MDHPSKFVVPGWQPLDWSPPSGFTGQAVRVDRLRPRHAADLHAANIVDDGMWAFLPYGPFDSVDDYATWVDWASSSDDPYFYAFADGEGFAGVGSLMRVDLMHGVIEVGHIALSRRLQRTRAATEALCLVIAHAFDAGFRRFEWKCDAANAPSMHAAERLGFRYEGTFRQHLVVKGRNRDTAWFSITDAEWPAVKAAHDTWLSGDNFDADGNQVHSLRDLIGRIPR